MPCALGILANLGKLTAQEPQKGELIVASPSPSAVTSGAAFQARAAELSSSAQAQLGNGPASAPNPLGNLGPASGQSPLPFGAPPGQSPVPFAAPSGHNPPLGAPSGQNPLGSFGPVGPASSQNPLGGLVGPVGPASSQNPLGGLVGPVGSASGQNPFGNNVGPASGQNPPGKALRRAGRSSMPSQHDKTQSKYHVRVNDHGRIFQPHDVERSIHNPAGSGAGRDPKVGGLGNYRVPATQRAPRGHGLPSSRR